MSLISNYFKIISKLANAAFGVIPYTKFSHCPTSKYLLFSSSSWSATSSAPVSMAISTYLSKSTFSSLMITSMMPLCSKACLAKFASPTKPLKQKTQSE